MSIDAERGQRPLALVSTLTARLTGETEPLQARDLPFAFAARGMSVGQAGDQTRNAVTQLQREMGGGSAHQLAHVLDAHSAIALPAQAGRILSLAQGAVVWVGSLAGAPEAPTAGSAVGRELISNIESSSAWVVEEMALSSPTTHP
jgi:hypothetical protein